MKNCYRRDNPGPSATDGALGWTLLWAVYQRENGVWGSQERHRMQTCFGGPGQWTNWKGFEKTPWVHFHRRKRPARMVFEQKSLNAVKASPSPSSTKSSACAGGRGSTWKHERRNHSHSTRKYQGIPRLSIVLKLFARVVLKRLQVVAERFCEW